MWEIVDAIGSASSAALAGIAGVVAYRLFKVESARDQRAEELTRLRDDEARREQAGCIGLWVDLEPQRDLSPVVIVHLANHSNLPIYNVTLFNETARQRNELGEMILAEWQAIPPGRTEKFELDINLRAAEFGLKFSDNAYRDWYRTARSLVPI